MNIRVLSPDRLTDRQIELWSLFQESNPELQSPFFHPFYTREAAKSFAGVEVAVFEDAGETLAFFPFQRTAGNRGIPVAGSLNDLQGVVSPRGFVFDAAELVRACRLSGLRFSQLLAAQQPFHSYHWHVADSPSMDLREGFDAFARQRRDEGSTLISRTRKKVRMAVREVGPMRFEADSRDSRIFDLLMEWKSQHFRRIRVPNPLAAPGVLDFLKRLLALRDDAFRGMVSVLYYGDRPAAAHVGIRCRNVLHSSVTAYNGELARYSPGIALAVELARAAEKIGICRIDLGAGNECFKTSFRSFGTQVAAGGVGLGSLATSMQRSWLCTKRWLQASRLHRPARYVFRTIRGLFLHEPQHDC